MQVYSTAVGEIRPIVLDEWISVRMNTGTGAAVMLDDEHCTVVGARAARFSIRVRDVKNMDLLISKGQVTVGTTQVGVRADDGDVNSVRLVGTKGAN